jgi:glycosyltransferase involved in cell wall biosynthesis
VTVAVPPPAGPVQTGVSAPTFSVLITAYQEADYVADAVASALSQTKPPHEVVVCDDGSTDDIEGALAPYRDDIVLLRQENRGVASARNAAAAAASGDFLAILDADDIYMPDRLAALGRLAAERPDLEVLTTDAYLEVNGQVVRRAYTPSWTFPVNDQRSEILRRNFVLGLAAVRREVLLGAGGWDESFRFAEDWECWVRLLLNGSRVGCVVEPLARYRVRENSLSTNRVAMLEGEIKALGKALTHPRIRPEENLVARGTIARLEQELAVDRLREALRTRALGARRCAAAIATDRAAPLPTRLKAAAAAVAPGAVGFLLNRRDRREWRGAGGTTVRRA